MFGEEGVWNYSTMLLREDLGLLLLGARENIYALDINNISNKKSSVRTLKYYSLTDCFGSYTDSYETMSWKTHVSCSTCLCSSDSSWCWVLNEE